MDPDATLSHVRELAATLPTLLAEIGDPDAMDEDVTEALDQAGDLAEAVKALDEWLSKGGFLPTEWAPTRTFDQFADEVDAVADAGHQLSTSGTRALKEAGAVLRWLQRQAMSTS